ncbi:hypothetical protein SCMU_23060 [Sinomonas cyclohexanicum]|uniref:Uncharacterized protein n=1 Tax=Sinomonas cyclohexanicum TaxID=322009 RepID=A0ABN6FIJ6_SINCY|nr:hypothetical protein SCMU_23060 [Corynebacterium cyclohexanicum]
MQMTRKRMGTGLLEVFSETCEVCAGRGVITHDEPVERGGSRPSAPAPEHQQARTESPAAGGRKRRRRGNGQQPDGRRPVAAAPVPAAPAVDDPDRQARAQATRAALAAVAAAAHAAHVHDDEAAAAKAMAAPAAGAPAAPAVAEPARGEAAHQEEKPTEASVAEAVAAAAPAARAEATHAPVADTGHGDAARAVLTIGGERIELPHGDAVHEPPAPEPVLSLDALSHAFDELTGERHTPGEAEPRAGRRRRGRGARSGQGSAEVTRVDASGGAVGGQTRSASAPAPQQEKQTPPDDGGPLILGVGVPASEL